MKVVIVDHNYLGGEDLFKSEINTCIENNIEIKLERCKSEKDIIDVAQDADIVLCCGNPPITENVINSLENVKAYIRYGIGVNSVDIEAVTNSNKIVYNMPGFCTEELAMHASAMILNILRNITFYDSKIRKGMWPKAQGPKPRRLSNLTIGLFGFGGSAKELAKIFNKGYGSKVIAYDPFLPKEVFLEYEVEEVELEDLLRNSDVISIHTPLNEATRGIFNRNFFEKMKSNSIIINIAKGEIINQEDLILALEKGSIGFAGLDVFKKEPIESNDRITNLDNIIMTPHSAFYGEESLQVQHETAAYLIKKTLIDKEVVFENLYNKSIHKNILL